MDRPDRTEGAVSQPPPETLEDDRSGLGSEPDAVVVDDFAPVPDGSAERAGGSLA